MKVYELFELYADGKNRDREFKDILDGCIIFYEDGVILSQDYRINKDDPLSLMEIPSVCDITQLYSSYNMLNREIEEIIND